MKIFPIKLSSSENMAHFANIYYFIYTIIKFIKYYSSITCSHNLKGPWGICQRFHSEKSLQIPHKETTSET